MFSSLLYTTFCLASLVTSTASANSFAIYSLKEPSQKTNGDSTAYEVIRQKVREGTAQDRHLIAAERAFTEAEKLRGEWNSKSFFRAISKYDEARTHWQVVNNQEGEAKALKNIGEIYSILSQNEKALNYYNQALALSRALDQRQLEIESLNNIGEINIDLGDREAALDYCKQALTLSNKTGYLRGQAQSLRNIGLVHHLLSDFNKALDSFNQSLDLSRAIGDHRGQAQTLTNMAYSYADLGNTQKGLSCLDEALPLWQKSKDRKGEALALTAIALLSSSQGDMQKALDTHTKAIRFLQAIGDQTGEAVALNGLAYVYDILGDKHKALDLYDRALLRYRAAGRRSSEAITMGLIGEIYYSLGDKVKALDYYNQNLNISRSLGDRRAEAYTLRDIGMVFDSSGEREKALDYFNRALSLSKSASDPRAQAYTLNSIGYVYESTEQKDKALGCYKQALALNQATEDRAAEITTLHNIARVTRNLGDFEGAYNYGRTLLNLVETVRTKVASQELRTSYFASVHQHYELYVDILMQLHRLNPAAGYATAALEASERVRGRVLLDLLNEAQADIRAGVDPALLEQERDIQQLLNTKGERQVRLLTGKYTEEQALVIKKEIADITTQYEDVLSQIRSTSPKFAALTQPPALSLSEIQQQVLDANTMLLEYLLGDERSYLWAVTQTSIRAYELPGRSKIEHAAKSLYRALASFGKSEKSQSQRQRQALREKADAQYSTASAQLSEMLLNPIASELGTKRLIIVADGALQYIPFAALSDPAEPKQHPFKAQPLMVNHEVINLPSVSILLALRKEIEGRRQAPKALAVLADPVFEEDDPRVDSKGRANKKSSRSTALQATRGTELMVADESSNNGGERLRFQRLPFASREAISIANLVPEEDRKLALGFDASLSTVLAPDLQQYRIVHFATHGLIHGVHPQLYGIVLSLVDRKGNPQDGFLRLNRIFNLKIPVELVVLSACQTALGKEIKGEGLVGLVRGFMYAGTARIVASLWRVDDRASAELMKYFYEALLGQQRLRPAAALQSAQIQMWKQQRWRFPYYWAAFILQGEWK